MYSKRFHENGLVSRNKRRTGTSLRVVRLFWCLIAIALALATSGYGFEILPNFLGAGSHAASPMYNLEEIGRPTPRVATPTPTVQIKHDPVRLVIPAIALDVAIEPVGLLTNGDLGTPVQSPWENAGWYNLGPHPGERGSAIIDGHLDRPGGAPAVFWDLRKLVVGDAITVIDSAGLTLHFHVTHYAYFPPQSAPLQDIFGDNTGTYLNLMTCAGYWVPSEHQTTLRLVVYTTLG